MNRVIHEKMVMVEFTFYRSRLAFIYSDPWRRDLKNVWATNGLKRNREHCAARLRIYYTAIIRINRLRKKARDRMERAKDPVAFKAWHKAGLVMRPLTGAESMGLDLGSTTK